MATLFKLEEPTYPRRPRTGQTDPRLIVRIVVGWIRHLITVKISSARFARVIKLSSDLRLDLHVTRLHRLEDRRVLTSQLDQQ